MDSDSAGASASERDRPGDKPTIDRLIAVVSNVRVRVEFQDGTVIERDGSYRREPNSKKHGQEPTYRGSVWWTEGK